MYERVLLGNEVILYIYAGITSILKFIYNIYCNILHTKNHEVKIVEIWTEFKEAAKKVRDGPLGKKALVAGPLKKYFFCGFCTRKL